MRYKNEDDSRHELKILLAAAVVSVLAAVTAAGLVPAESAAGEADGQAGVYLRRLQLYGEG